jgi:hypothetical protein
LTPNSINASPTPGGSNINVNNNTNANNNSNSNSNNNNIINNVGSAALPQVAEASGLVVTVAFLSAFLVSRLTLSLKISSDPTLHPALGFCSREL